MNDKKAMFAQLKKLLIKHSNGLETKTKLENSTMKDKKEMFGLQGKNEAVIMNRKPQKTYVAGIIMQKHFVGFYSMPMYSHSKQLPLKHPLLKKMRKGKSCINITELNADMLKELDSHLRKGIEVYKKEKWI